VARSFSRLVCCASSGVQRRVQEFRAIEEYPPNIDANSSTHQEGHHVYVSGIRRSMK
jgi:hypothetical protein